MSHRTGVSYLQMRIGCWTTSANKRRATAGLPSTRSASCPVAMGGEGLPIASVARGRWWCPPIGLLRVVVNGVPENFVDRDRGDGAAVADLQCTAQQLMSPNLSHPLSDTGRCHFASRMRAVMKAKKPERPYKAMVMFIGVPLE